MITNADKKSLMAIPAFRRFCFDLIQRSGFFDVTANGSDGRNLYLEGRRSLGLEVLRDLDAAQPVQPGSGAPILTLIQLLREAAQSTPQETTRERPAELYADISEDDAA